VLARVVERASWVRVQFFREDRLEELDTEHDIDLFYRFINQ
jgi:hypothetical protein